MPLTVGNHKSILGKGRQHALQPPLGFHSAGAPAKHNTQHILLLLHSVKFYDFRFDSTLQTLAVQNNDWQRLKVVENVPSRVKLPRVADRCRLGRHLRKADTAITGQRPDGADALQRQKARVWTPACGSIPGERTEEPPQTECPNPSIGGDQANRRIAYQGYHPEDWSFWAENLPGRPPR